jgi:methylase of polypeptide subunit release factors
VAALGQRLYLHSAFPTDAPDAVFFGPDSYRFAALIERELAGVAPRTLKTVIDIGTGAGVGALVAAGACGPARAIGTDVNPVALRFAAINAAAAGIALELLEGEGLAGFEGPIDLALANPPYIVDRKARDYRDGGGLHGGAVSLEMARAALPRLAPGGRLILYTGSAITSGRDEFAERLSALAGEQGAELRYWELDPDVFGEELAGEAYRDVDRIAVVAAVFTRRR